MRALVSLARVARRLRSRERALGIPIRAASATGAGLVNAIQIRMGICHPTGAYVLEEGADAVLIGTGSEVSLCLAARELLAAEGVSARVVSMPSWELFAAQPEAYQAQVLPPGVPRITVEAAVSLGWRRWADATVSLDRFGASAPGDVLFERFGFTAENVAAKARELLR